MAHDPAPDELPATWGYRVVRLTDGTYGIYEVYYGADGQPRYRTARPVGLVGEGMDDLRAEFLNYQRALYRPVLDDWILAEPPSPDATARPDQALLAAARAVVRAYRTEDEPFARSATAIMHLAAVIAHVDQRQEEEP